MLLLTLVAVVAGAGTALSPCVFPVLPALLAAGASGGRRRPVGIVVGLAATFTVTIVGLAEVVDGVGLGDGATRTLAIAALLAFGLLVLAPPAAHAVEARLSRLSRLGPRTSDGDGFRSGLIVGGALGFLYAPCAGPVLAAVIAVSATSASTVAVAAGYAAGSSAVLLAVMLGGRRAAGTLRTRLRGPVVQRALGGVLVLTGGAMALDLDVRFQTAIADGLPQTLVTPTAALEESDAVETRLRGLRGAPRFDSRAARPAVSPPPLTTLPAGRGRQVAAGPSSGLPRLGRAPELVGTQRWFNTPGGRPLTLAQLRAQRRVVLVDFWTYTCINCIRTFPGLRALDSAYRDDGLTIIGVHTPEFAFEKDAGNVADAISQSDLRHPIVQDNDYATWNAWGNRYWPAKYLVDADGQVRYTHFGEGGEEETEAAVRALLAEAGATEVDGRAGVADGFDPARRATPETYLGSDRAERFLGTPPTSGTRRYEPVPSRELLTSHLTLGGTWRVDGERSTAVEKATIRGRLVGKDVYLVMSASDDAPADVRVRLGGRPIPRSLAGADVRDGRVRVGAQTIYHLVSAPRAEEHELSLSLDDGVSAYAFTFG